MHRDTFRRPAWWILASAAGFLTYFWLAIHPADSTLEFVIVGSALGTAGASVTGLLLTRLPPRPLTAIP